VRYGKLGAKGFEQDCPQLAPIFNQTLWPPESEFFLVAALACY